MLAGDPRLVLNWNRYSREPVVLYVKVGLLGEAVLEDGSQPGEGEARNIHSGCGNEVVPVLCSQNLFNRH